MQTTVTHTSSVPSKEDWDDFTGDFDVADAYAAFFGRSNSEMQKSFEKDFMMRAQDLRFMPRVPFMYYILGFTEFLMHGSYDHDAVDIGNCYLDVVESHFDLDLFSLVPIADTGLTGLTFIATNPGKFEGDQQLYGDFTRRLTRIDRIVSSIKAKKEPQRNRIGTAEGHQSDTD